MTLASLLDAIWYTATDEGLPDGDVEFFFRAGFVAALQLPLENEGIAAARAEALALLTAPSINPRRFPPEFGIATMAKP